MTVQILDIVHRPVFYLKHEVSQNGLCLRLRVECIQVGQIELVSVSVPLSTEPT
jgi:hypothetical protein